MAPRSARAQDVEPSALWELSGFLGVHGFSDRSALGAVDGSRASISNAIALGARVGHLVWPSLLIEGELPLALSSARDTNVDVKIAIFEPRVHVRYGLGVHGRIEPFATAGIGMPISLSTKRYIVASDILATLYAGGGLRLVRADGWNLRADARAVLVPARESQLVTPEFELSVSLYRSFGAGSARRREPEIVDQDNDGILDSVDRCPTRDEDRDGTDDQDGCPDIDDDHDEILDIADTCRLEPEVRNGFRDEDGCPDVVPDELREVLANSQDLLFNSGEAALRAPARNALQRVAERLAEFPSVRLLIIGHTDDREAPDQARALSLQRAEAVRARLIELGIPARRLEVAGSGAASPVADNQTTAGRVRNRRVELQIWIAGQSNQFQSEPDDPTGPENGEPGSEEEVSDPVEIEPDEIEIEIDETETGE